VLDADLAAAFDRIDHSRLLAALGSFPARRLVEQWLKAGVVDKGRFAPTEEGTPQGGVVSPLLLNVALHGMEEARCQDGRADPARRPGRGRLRSVSYQWSVTWALAAGASDAEVVAVLVALAPIVGRVRVMAAAPEVALAIGCDVDVPGDA
jgi:hypothetical protein